MKSILLLLLPSLFPFVSFSQANFLWADRMGSAGSDAGWAIASDNSGNIYTTGFFTGTVDFDPGAGTVNLTSAGLEDIFICKTGPSGNLLWAKSIGGPDGDRGFSLTVDAAGNVYATGAFVGTADFDPGAGTFNMTSGSTYGDMFIVKLSTTGGLVWAKQFGGTGGISGYAIALDASGNVHATGSFTGNIDFDPGAGTYNLTSTGSYDIYVCKTDAMGNFLWAKQMGGTAGYEVNVSNAITVDAGGNVYTTGASEYVTDFDPGPGFYPLDSAGFFISKLDASGNFVWAKQIVSPNVLGNAITTDNTGNVIVAGSYAYSADFDPGPAVNTQSSPSSRDIFILKLDAAGNFVWMKQMGSASSGDYAYAIRTDGAGNVYSAGSFQDVADFDPGSASFDLTSAGADDIFISKLDAAGNFICATQVGGTSVDYAYGITLDAGNNIFITGAFMDAVDFDPGAGTDIHTSAGIEDIFISAVSDCTFATGISATVQPKLNVYPNPATDQVFIDGSFSSAGLFNELGERMDIPVKNNCINVSGLKSGIYLLRLTTENEQVLQRIIKE
jgi:hypothetical protein